jgi:putative peptidoglycan lipid II flippase
MLAISLPGAALLAVGVRPLVEGFFGFEPARLNLVTWCTWAFLAGLLGDAWLETAVRSFYANQNTRTPMLAAIIQAVVFVLLALLLSNRVGLPGIPIAAAITFTIQAIVLLSIQNRLFPGLLKMEGTLIRAILAAITGGVVAYVIMKYLPLPSIITVLVAMVGGAVSVLPFIWKEVRLLAHL